MMFQKEDSQDNLLDRRDEKKGRIDWLDICKGIAILLMVLGHIRGIPTILRKSIFSFHMPLFMIINGYLIFQYDIKKSIAKSSRSLLRPYFIICLIQALIAAFLETTSKDAGTTLFAKLDDMVIGMSKISSIFSKYGSVWLVWFICCLFLSRNIYILICELTKGLSQIYRYFVIIVLSFLGVFISKKIGFFPWSFDVALASLVFIATGDIIHKCSLSEKSETIIACVSLLLWLLLLHHNMWIELAVRSYKGGALCFVCAIAGSIVFICISRIIDKKWVGASFFKWAGKNSIVILGIHCIEMRFINWNTLLYEPLGITVSWWGDFLFRVSIILTLSFLFVRFKKIVLKRRFTCQIVNEKRIEWIDIAKGFCIISIVLGHLGVEWINRIVYTYHVPVFFIISGFLLKQTDTVLLVKKKTKRLVLPYLFTCMTICLIAMIKAIMDRTSITKALLYWIDAGIYGSGNSYNTPYEIKSIGGIWFLLAMFAAIIIANHVLDKPYYHIYIMGIAYLGWAIANIYKIWLPFSIQGGMLASLYILIGYEMKKLGLLKSLRGVIIGCAWLITVFGIQHFNGIWLVRAFYGNGLIDVFVTIAASIIVLWLSMYISRSGLLFKRILIFFGKHSLLILCAHIVDLNVLEIRKRVFEFAKVFSINNNHTIVLLFLTRIVYLLFIVLIFSMFRKWTTRIKKSEMVQQV